MRHSILQRLSNGFLIKTPSAWAIVAVSVLLTSAWVWLHGARQGAAPDQRAIFRYARPLATLARLSMEVDGSTQRDIGLMNLTCATDLPRSEALNIQLGC
jgi:hypothetical protein